MATKTTLETLNQIYTSQLDTSTDVHLSDSVGNEIDLTSSVTHGENVAHWRRVIATGGNATTNLTGTRWKVSQSSASLRLEETNKPPNPSYLGISTVTGNPLWVDTNLQFDDAPSGDANNRALTQFYANLASVQSRFKGLVFTGELRQTLNMIKSPAKALRHGIDHYLTALKKGSRYNRRDRPSFVRRTWLEYAFGWRPLIADLDRAVDAFYASDVVRPLFEMVSGRGYAENVTDTAHIQTPIYANIRIRSIKRNTLSSSYKYFGVTSSYGNGSSNSHSYGFNPVEFVPTLWELMPYSFLVDYFTNIGDILSSWSYRFIGTDWLSSSSRQTVSSEMVRSVPEVADQFPWSNYNLSGSAGSIKVERTRVNRTRNAVLDLPRFEFRCPGFDSRWVNIVALSANLGVARRSLL